eukprot:1158898-Pelagomonas_calceolata.AAC.2
MACLLRQYYQRPERETKAFVLPSLPSQMVECLTAKTKWLNASLPKPNDRMPHCQSSSKEAPI